MEELQLVFVRPYVCLRKIRQHSLVYFDYCVFLHEARIRRRYERQNTPVSLEAFGSKQNKYILSQLVQNIWYFSVFNTDRNYIHNIS